MDNIIHPSHTIGAAILEFDFIPNGDSVQFNYVFASDEYPRQICHPHSDVFAFHISGPGIDGMKNIALIPGTDLPVGNNSINDTSLLIHFPEYEYASGTFNIDYCISLEYPQYYVDHTNDSTLIFNGSTTVLTAKEATVPCQTYHMRLAIANGVNFGESPAVFIEANSFNSEPLKIESSVSYGNNDTLLYEGCGYAQLKIKRTYNIQQTKSYTISVQGSAQNGIDYEYIPQEFTMDAGEMYHTLHIYPKIDSISDNMETIQLSIGDTLCNGNYYETDIEIIIFEKESFEMTIENTDSIFCDTAMFTANVQGAFLPLHYRWNNYSNSDTFLYYPSFDGHYKEDIVTLELIDGCGNKVEDTLQLTYSKQPSVAFSYSPSFIDINNPIVQFKINQKDELLDYTWTFGDGSGLSHIKNPTHTFLDTGSYEVVLKVENKFNCIESVSKLILINESPILIYPNGFSPNQDGINDEFKPLKKVGIKKGNINIYNRWGMLVYSSQELDKGWNGKYNNKTLKTGTYFWVVEYTDFYDMTKIEKGSLSLFL